jgi:thymidylate synthase
MKAYKHLCYRVLGQGVRNSSRAGDTVYRFGETLELNLRDGFPLLTLRKIDYIQAFGELAAFIRGETTKEAFTALGCHYWNTTGGEVNELGPIYGYQWRNWGADQLLGLIDNLQTSPDSRRHILAAWNVEDLDKMVLVPCHILAQFDVTPGKVLNCVVYMRSVDIMLGLPYDIAIYALLTHLLADICSYTAGELKFFFGNAHVYANHIKQAEDLLLRQPYDLPTLVLDCPNILKFHPMETQLEDYICHPPMKFELNL